MNVEQSVLCALLGRLLDKRVIGQELHDTAKKQILGTPDWPEFFHDVDGNGKKHVDGDS